MKITKKSFCAENYNVAKDAFPPMQVTKEFSHTTRSGCGDGSAPKRNPGTLTTHKRRNNIS